MNVIVPLLLSLLAGSVDAAWTHDRRFAASDLDDGWQLSVAFFPPSCAPVLRIGKPVGNNTTALPTTTVKIGVDGSVIVHAHQSVHELIELDPTAVAALRRGALAGVTLGSDTNLSFDLAGSAKAIRAAERRCKGPAPVNPSTGWVRVSGDIEEGDAARAMQAIQAAGASGVILETPGGRVWESKKLARWIRSNGLDTAVIGECASACVVAWAGGVRRYIAPDARLGLHRSATNVGSYEDGQEDVADHAAFLREMGVEQAEKVAVRAASVASNRMSWVDADEALQLGLATKIGLPPALPARAVEAPVEELVELEDEPTPITARAAENERSLIWIVVLVVLGVLVLRRRKSNQS
jgi:hypothetical protein